MYNNEQCVFVVRMYIVNMSWYTRTLCIKTHIQLSQMVTTAVSQCLSTYMGSYHLAELLIFIVESFMTILAMFLWWSHYTNTSTEVVLVVPWLVPRAEPHDLAGIQYTPEVVTSAPFKRDWKVSIPKGKSSSNISKHHFQGAFWVFRVVPAWKSLTFMDFTKVNGSEGRYRITTSWQTASDLRRHPDWLKS